MDPTPVPSDEEEIFEKASELTDLKQREAYLVEACGSDQALLKRLRGLLSASEQANRFFSDSQKALDTLLPDILEPTPAAAAGGATSRLSGAELIGTTIGRYHLLELIGEGGWGVVYLAEQKEPVQRKVALKIIRAGMESSMIVARFEAERQALAMMDHPCIARVFDAGETDRGFPYFVMELVQGEKITEYCDRNNLSVEARLNLFVRICHAIQHAHQKGVIHRDIKPSNIMVTMVDGEPVPKVIDFGIAKATEARLSDKAAGTAFVQLIGTPAYMSPEQAELRWLDVDTRSDIYSLGVLLYELLVGCTPFDPDALTKAGINEMRRTLTEVEPPRPSARFALRPFEERARCAKQRATTIDELYRTLLGDLDWIVMKALEKERRQRFETANGLAMDIARFLSHETVTARPPSLWYILGKAVRRNRLLFAAGAAVAIALMAGTGVSTWLLFREREMRQRAVEAEQQQARLRTDAENRARITKASLLISQERYEEVDGLLRSSTGVQASIEAASAFRALGEWHAIEGRHDVAVQLFRQLRMLDTFDGWDIMSLDSLRLGPELLLAGDTAGYETFRNEVLTEYLSDPKPSSDRIIKICILTPVPQSMIERLSPLADLSRSQVRQAEDNGDAFQAAWTCMSLAVWEYRCGNLALAEEWARRCLRYPDYNAPRSATAHAILALVAQANGDRSGAHGNLVAGVDFLQSRSRMPLGRGNPVQGFWFDWAYSRILITEAAKSLGEEALVHNMW